MRERASILPPSRPSPIPGDNTTNTTTTTTTVLTYVVWADVYPNLHPSPTLLSSSSSSSSSSSTPFLIIIIINSNTNIITFLYHHTQPLPPLPPHHTTTSTSPSTSTIVLAHRLTSILKQHFRQCGQVTPQVTNPLTLLYPMTLLYPSSLTRYYVLYIAPKILPCLLYSCISHHLC